MATFCERQIANVAIWRQHLVTLKLNPSESGHSPPQLLARIAASANCLNFLIGFSQTFCKKAKDFIKNAKLQRKSVSFI